MKYIMFLFGVFLSMGLAGAQLENGSFEKVEASMLNKTSWHQKFITGWDILLNCGYKNARAVPSKEAYDGSYSLKLTNLDRQCFVSVQQDVEVEPDTEIVASMMAKAPDRGDVFFRIYFFQPDGELGKNYLMSGFKPREDWTLCQYPFRVPKGVTKMRFAIQTIKQEEPNRAIFIDKVELHSKAGPILSNGLIRAQVNPLVGGVIDSLSCLKDGKTLNFTLPRTMNKVGGLAVDVIPAGKLPGIFSLAPFEMKVLIPRRKIQVSCVAGGEALPGLRLTKLYSLEPDSFQVMVEVELTNTSQKPLEFDYRITNCLEPSDGIFSAPTKDWLQAFRKTSESIQTVNSINVENLGQNWLAKTMEGATFLAEFRMEQFKNAYHWVSSKVDTIEWYYDKLRLAPGESWKTSFSLNAVMSDSMIFAFDGTLAYGREDSSNTVSATAVLPVSRKLNINGVDQEIKLKAGEKVTLSHDLPETRIAADGFSASLGTVSGYKPSFIQGVKLPDPAPRTPLKALENVFLYAGSDVALTWRESSGTSRDHDFRNTTDRMFREFAANYVNSVYVMRCLVRGDLEKARLPGGKYVYGEQAMKYDLKIIPSYIFHPREYTEFKKFQPELKKKIDLVFHDEYLKFLQTYKEYIPFMITGDEPRAHDIPIMLDIHKEIAKVIPDIPLFPILNMHTRAYIPYLPAFLGDWYPINREAGRQPWTMGTVVAETVKMAEGTPVLVMPQAFGYREKGYALPGPADIRLMVYLAVANGAKGILWHEIGNRGIPWRCNYGYNYSLYGNTGETTVGWEALGECGREMLAIGPLLLSSAPVSDDRLMEIICEEYKSDNNFFKGPAVQSFRLEDPKQGNFFFLINNRIEGPSTAKFKMSLRSGETMYSLTAMKAIAPEGEVTLKAGDTVIFFAGKDEAVKQVSERVATNRYHRDKIVLHIATDRAKANGVDLSAMESIEKQADVATPLVAYALLSKINQAYVKAMNVSKFGDFSKEWKKIRNMLSDASFLFETHLDLVCSPELREKTPRYKRHNNTADPSMQKLVDAVCDDWQEYWRIDRMVENGEWSTEKEAAQKLITKTHSDVTAAVAYLQANEHKIKVDDPYQ